jgi:plastocyanin
MRTTLSLLSASILSLGLCNAATLEVLVRTDEGEPVADAVVTVVPAVSGSRQATSFPWPLRIGQRDMQFDPSVLIVPAGAQVAFPNYDKVRHHVYSFSPTKKFEIQLYGKDETRSVSFPVAGVVAIGCNIHDAMSAFIYVSDTPYAAKTDAAGKVRVSGLPTGAATMRIWHPQSTSPQQQTEQPVTLTPDDTNTTAVDLDLRPKRRVRHGAY